jgi:hypothetical protein
VVVLVVFGEETFKRALKAKLVEALREELTSGDGNVKALLTQLLLSAVLRDSAGAELSSYIKNLNVGLDTRASEATLAGIKSQTDKFNFTAEGFLRGSIATSEIIVPVDLQARYKPPGLTLFSGTVTSNGNTADIDLSLYSIVEIEVKVTAVSGTTPTLDVYIEGRFEATGDYKVLASVTGITSTGVWFLTINPLVFRFIRIRWVVGGTSPSFTFTVVAQAMV